MEKETLNRSAAADYLRINPRTLSRWMDPNVPGGPRITGAQKVGRELLFPKAELDRIREEREALAVAAGGAMYSVRFVEEAFRELVKEDALEIDIAATRYRVHGDPSEKAALAAAVARTADYRAMERLIGMCRRMARLKVELADETERNDASR